MSAGAVERQQATEELERLRLLDVLEDCWTHPAFLLNEVNVVDQRTGERFQFTGMLDPDDDWAWQREVLDWWLDNRRTLILKARQLGITYVAAGLALWYLLFKPGSRVLVYSIGEDEAKIVAQRIWMMYQSLPEQLRAHVRPIKPRRTERVSDEIVFAHDTMTHSSVRALASTKAAGHSEVAALAILDEYAYNDNSLPVLKAVLPATGAGTKQQGKVIIVSTANGVAGELEGANTFYALDSNPDKYRLKNRFLGVFTHPDRDEQWYDEEAMALPDRERYESYPRTREEAYQGTGACWFDADAMAYYRDHALRDPLFLAHFEPELLTTVTRSAPTWSGKATLRHRDDGLIAIYQEPEEGKEYVIAVDPALGSGRDASAAYVLDLHTQAICAEIRSTTVDADMLATQLHYLGKFFNTARIAPERSGGWGGVVITALRDGREGRPPYPKIYRHRNPLRPDLNEEPQYGFLTTRQTRPQIISALEIAIREKTLPYMTRKLYSECLTFGAHVSGSGKPISPSPAAAPGTNDDTVLCMGIALYLYGLYGRAPTAVRSESRRKRFTKKRLAPRPWENT